MYFRQDLQDVKERETTYGEVGEARFAKRQGRGTTKEELGKTTLSNRNGRENALKCRYNISIKINIEK
jgi:hypothetical protein